MGGVGSVGGSKQETLLCLFRWKKKGGSRERWPSERESPPAVKNKDHGSFTGRIAGRDRWVDYRTCKRGSIKPLGGDHELAEYA